MPRRVDQHERRTRIADALLRVAGERGAEVVSIRHVAAEAGVSTGMVQHHFRTKDEMLLFALDTVSERIQDRLTGDAADLAQPAVPGDFLRALLIQQLPFDETRRIEARVVLAFHAYAAHDSTIADRLRVSNAELRAYLADLIRSAQAACEAPARLPPQQTAAALLALVEGLGVQAVAEHREPEEVLDTLDTHLKILFEETNARSPAC